VTLSVYAVSYWEVNPPVLEATIPGSIVVGAFTGDDMYIIKEYIVGDPYGSLSGPIGDYLLIYNCPI